MTAPLHPSLALTIGIAALIAWRMVSRVRRMVGRQRLSSRRPWFSVVVFPLLAAMLFLVALARPTAMLGLVAGCAAGVVLGLVGLHLTRFEATPAGHYYTPNPYLGVALSMLLIARIAWRYVQIFGVEAPLGASTADFGRSPLTLLIFGMLAGYYTTYSAGLLRWKHRLEPDPPVAKVD